MLLLPIASRLPMRNWNPTPPASVWDGIRFQTTYEELKLAKFITTRRRSKKGFQTTYEELKQLSRVELLNLAQLPDYLWGIETGFLCTKREGENGFQTTYEELKQVKERRLVRRIRLPDYLWGIETRRHTRLLREHSPLPDYLWGIETGFLCTKREGENEASRLPMRNWNLPGVAGSESQGRELPDYLWGIETGCRQHCCSFHWFRFQTTYEELKLEQRAFVKPRSSRFQTTYEELKPSWSCFFILFFCFQTTYEELKHAVARLTVPNPTASRLPMRNWNRKTTRELRPITLPDYLWGIETRRPMRWRGWSPQGFQTTYEELKLSLATDGTGAITLPDYLWGIETILSIRGRYISTVLPDYLWGIETNQAYYSYYTGYASRLPMRNWN